MNWLPWNGCTGITTNGYWSPWGISLQQKLRQTTIEQSPVRPVKRHDLHQPASTIPGAVQIVETVMTGILMRPGIFWPLAWPPLAALRRVPPNVKLVERKAWLWSQDPSETGIGEAGSQLWTYLSRNEQV